jgi:hypothetical protein
LVKYQEVILLIFLFFQRGSCGTKSSGTAAIYWPNVLALDDGDDCGAISGINEWHEKQKYSEETCPSIILPTTDTT